MNAESHRKMWNITVETAEKKAFGNQPKARTCFRYKQHSGFLQSGGPEGRDPSEPNSKSAA